VSDAYAVGRGDADEFEPFAPDGVPVGEIHWLRQHDAGGRLAAAVWRAEPCAFDYVFDSDEACYVLEGEASVHLPDRGETVDLRAGDTAWFPEGTRAVWTVKRTFRKFVVGPADPPA
jgi:uncharacterized cupin superfamily protein